MLAALQIWAQVSQQPASVCPQATTRPRLLGRIAEKGLMDGLTGDVADKLCESRLARSEAGVASAALRCGQAGLNG